MPSSKLSPRHDIKLGFFTPGSIPHNRNLSLEPLKSTLLDHSQHVVNNKHLFRAIHLTIPDIFLKRSFLTDNLFYPPSSQHTERHFIRHPSHTPQQQIAPTGFKHTRQTSQTLSSFPHRPLHQPNQKAPGPQSQAKASTPHRTDLNDT